jgi:hypothetical protein
MAEALANHQYGNKEVRNLGIQERTTESGIQRVERKCRRRDANGSDRDGRGPRKVRKGGKGR